MQQGGLEPWQLLLVLAAGGIAALQAWWDFAEGRVRGPLGHIDRKTNPFGFWCTQLLRLGFVLFAVVFTVAAFI
jgi:hypothetical protein